jgi:hypothetical protein
MKYSPGDTVSFTHHAEDEAHWIIGEVEQIRAGYQGDDLLVIRQGGPWSGDRYLVLSSYTESLATPKIETSTSITLNTAANN